MENPGHFWVEINNQKLIASGKAAKIAITAIMRKLIVLANALLRDKRNWTPNTSC